MNRLVLGLFVFTSCMLGMWLTQCSSTPTIQKEQLFGAWEIREAIRSGKPTETLNGAYFEFDEHDQMLTNLLGKESSHPYEYDRSKQTIKQLNNNTEGSALAEYTVTSLDGEVLRLATVIRDVDFQLTLHRIE